MAYRFTGFLAPGLDKVEAPQKLPADAVVRAIQVPFAGVGIALPSLIDKPLTAEHVLTLAAQTGIAAADAWLFIDYETWGRVDAVYACGSVGGDVFGPVEDTNVETVEATYVAAMARVGIREQDALDFPPFYRGFWGD